MYHDNLDCSLSDAYETSKENKRLKEENERLKGEINRFESPLNKKTILDGAKAYLSYVKIEDYQAIEANIRLADKLIKEAEDALRNIKMVVGTIRLSFLSIPDPESIQKTIDANEKHTDFFSPTS